MKRMLAFLLALICVLSLSAVTFAETEETFDFEIPEEVKKTDSIKKDDLASYYANTSYFTAMSSENNTVLENRSITVSGKTYSAYVYIHAFKVSDFTVPEDSDAEQEAEAFLGKYKASLSSSLSGTYLSLIALATEAKYVLSQPQEENGVTTLTIYTAIATPQKTEACSAAVAETVNPQISKWNGMDFGASIKALNEYLLSGAYRSGARSYSSVDFLKDKIGNSYDFAAAAYLFVSKMGADSVVILTGKNSTGATAWLLVKKDSNWYHLDLYGNAVFAESGTVSAASEKYLLVSTSEMKGYTIDSGRFSSYVAAAKTNYMFQENPDPEPDPDQDQNQNQNTVSKATLKALIDTAAASAAKEASYTTATFKAFSDAYILAQNVYADQKADAETVTQAYKTLKSALDGLKQVAKVDKSKLFEAISKNYDQNLYVADSYYTYHSAVTSAMKVYEDPEASQTQVDTTTELVLAAEKQLVKILDKDALLYYVQNIDSFIYSLTLNLSEESVANLTEVRDRFQQIYDSGAVTEEVLNEAAKEYNEICNHINAQEEIEASRHQQSTIISDNRSDGTVAAGTDIRTVLVIVSGLFTVLALASILLYFNPPKFFR